MGRAYPIDLIPDAGVSIDNGTYVSEIESLTPTTSKSGKLMINGTFRVVEPTLFAGIPLYDYFVIGSADDADASDPLTWQNSIGARAYKRVLTRARVAADGRDLDADCGRAAGRRLITEVEKVVEPAKRDDGSSNPYAGRTKNKIRGYWAMGERAVGNGIAPIAGGAGAAVVDTEPGPRLTCPVCTTAFTGAEYGCHVATH